MSESEAEKELVVKSIEGDHVALEQLLALHSFTLNGHIASKLPQSHRGLISVEDILQQTFLDAFRHIGKLEFRPDASFVAWLKTIADRNLQNVVKALGRKKRLGDQRRIEAVALDESGFRGSSGQHAVSREPYAEQIGRPPRSSGSCPTSDPRAAARLSASG